MSKKLSAYLAGVMEAADHLGEGWRNDLTPALVEIGIEVLDPCVLECNKLREYRPNSKLRPYTHWRTGKEVTPAYWHELKNAPIGSRLRNRFTTYMNAIKDYDLNIVHNVASMVIVYWDSTAARGAGTHAELDAAFKSNKPIYAVCDQDIPAWLASNITAEFKDFGELTEFLKEEFGE
jgi:hypothetical protein